MTKSYTFNGTINLDFGDWEQWVNNAFEICDILGYKINYYAVGVAGKTVGKIKPITGLSKKMAYVKKNEETITGMTFSVLPEDYESAAFDYVITLVRNANYITLIMNLDYEFNINQTLIVELLRKCIEAADGEVYEMDVYECPELYARKVNDKESFKTLKILEKLK